MTHPETAGQRLAKFRDGLGQKQREFAANLEFSPGLIGQIESGLAEPSRKVLQRLYERYNINSAWILEGREPMVFDAQPGFTTSDGSRIEPAQKGMPLHSDLAHNGEEFSFIRRLDLSVSAGNGLEAVEGGEADRLAFTRSWLLRNRVSADLSALVRVKGDSMSPTIPDGALVLVHMAENQIKAEAIYAFIRKGETFIKRILPIHFGPDGRPTSVVILSDNKDYLPDVVVAEAMNEIRIVGRVRCVLFNL